MTPALMKVYTSKLCTTMHTPEYEFLGGAETQYYGIHPVPFFWSPLPLHACTLKNED